jgi:hypothetical protein
MLTTEAVSVIAVVTTQMAMTRRNSGKTLGLRQCEYIAFEIPTGA